MLDRIFPYPLPQLVRLVTTGSMYPQRSYTFDDIAWIYYTVGGTLGLGQHQIRELAQPGPLPPRYRYRHFSIPKRDGSKREIVEPGPELKRIQRVILRSWLNRRTPHSAALGFRKGMSIADHAWAHAGAAIIITADIEDFFPSTRAWRVNEFWRELFSRRPAAADFLTRLTTYRGSLPQGAPTSPALSNLVNLRLDSQLYERARQSGGVYTRYADDMVFSWPDGTRPPADFEHGVRVALREHGYRLHPRKGWNVFRRRDEPEVTGLILTKRGEVDIPASMKRIMRELTRTAATEEEHRRLAGYEAYHRMIRDKRHT